MDKVKEVLTFLFESAKKDSNRYYDIAPIAGNDALMIANKLVKEGLIKDDILAGYAISIDGIRAADPSFVDQKINEILKATGDAGTIWNVVDILKAGPEAFQLCFDLANDMQNRDLVKLLYALYPSKVMIEMTLIGQQYSSRGGR
jgi:hypothetical protein